LPVLSVLSLLSVLAEMSEMSEIIPRDLFPLIVSYLQHFEIIRNLALTSSWINVIIDNNKYVLADRFAEFDSSVSYSKLPNGIKHGVFTKKHYSYLRQEIISCNYRLDVLHGSHIVTKYTETGIHYFTRKTIYNDGEMCKGIYIELNNEVVAIYDTKLAYATIKIYYYLNQISHVVKLVDQQVIYLKKEDWPENIDYKTLYIWYQR
jgi:hypothetical protein